MTKLDDTLAGILTEEFLLAGYSPEQYFAMAQLYQATSIKAMHRAYALGRTSVYEGMAWVREEDFHDILANAMERKLANADIVREGQNAPIDSDTAIEAMKRLHALLTDPDNPPLTKEQLDELLANNREVKP